MQCCQANLQDGFDRLGIDWHYETEGYDIKIDEGITIRYLPDFQLRGGSVRCPDPLFVEVKGNMQPDDALKIEAFSKHYPIYVVGEIPKDLDDLMFSESKEEYGILYNNFRLVDGDWYGATLGVCEDGSWGLFGADWYHDVGMDVARTKQAYAIARAAHFEY